MSAYMSAYAELPNVRLRQIVGDLIALACILVAVWAGMRLHDLVTQLAEPGRLLETAGTDLAERAGASAEGLANAPLVGDLLSSPLRAVADGGRALATAGASQQESVLDVALALGLATALVPTVAILVVRVPPRLAAARRAAMAARLRDAGAGAGEELLALRALTSRPLEELLAVAPDPMEAYRRGEHAALAALELRANGLGEGTHRRAASSPPG